ncbi:MAG: tetratricopeptide repeat protein, partial [Myxococcales bacterium]|nr:tetratricopeptide repeat protein [Myxococcales bacterium]
LEARIASLGPTHPAVATSLANVGAAHAARGDFASALPYFERALEIREAALGPAHPRLGAFLSDVGRALAALGRGAEARPLLERALAIDRARLGEDHPDVTAREHALGVLLLELGDLAAARPLLERVLERVSAGPHDGAAAALPSVAAALYAVARVDLLEGSHKAAKRRLQRALKVVDVAAEPLLVARVKKLLAALLRESRKTRGRGDQLAAEALAAFQAIDPQAHAEAIAELEAWIGPAAPEASATPTKRAKKRRKPKR